MNKPVIRFLGLAGRRLRSRLGLTLLSLLSVVLAVGIVVSIPVFAQGVSYLLLRDELVNLGKTFHRPPLTTRIYFITKENLPLALADAQTLGQRFRDLIAERTGLPIKYFTTFVSSPNLTLQPATGDTHYKQTKQGVIEEDLHLSVMTDIGKHIQIVEGEPFGTANGQGRVAVWVYEQLSNQLGLQIGENYDMVSLRTGKHIPVTIAGLWREADLNDFYWSGTTILWRTVFLVTEPDYTAQVEPAFPQKTGFTAWYVVPDDAGLTVARADAAAKGLKFAPSLADRMYTGARLDVSPEQALTHYLQRKASLSALLVGFSLPAMGLLFFFMWLLSNVTAQFQREEVASLASRGASRGFLAGLAVIETLILLVIGTPLGLGLGYLMARVMGLASNFLAFARRTEFPATLLELDVRLLTFAILILLLARLIPTLGAARAGIVAHLRARSRPRIPSGLVKVVVDLALILITVYAYQQLSQRGTLGIIGWEPTGDPFSDPLLLLTPSLFVLTVSLVLTHLFPLLMRPIDHLGGKLKSFPAYMALRRLYRQGGHYTSSLFLVMVCLSLGAFYASMALSLDEWLVARIRYKVGADYKFEQALPPPTMGGPSEFNPVADPAVVNAWLLPISEYLAIPGVERATRVGQFKATPKGIAGGESLFLGIDRLDFPHVMYSRADFTQAPLGELMNRLGMYPNGILVSSRFLSRNRLVEGQHVPLQVEVDNAAYDLDFLIVGVYDYFPTVYPADKEVFIGNLDHLFAQVGKETFYQIWMKTRVDADPAVIDKAVRDMGVYAVGQEEANALITIDEERVERIGLFGVLSVGFVATAILACLGLLVYTYASLQGRLQQISVLRAIGVKTRQVLTMVSIEYIGVIVYSILVGVVLGIITSYLFVPFFRVSGDAVFALPPFVRHIAWGKIAWLTLAFTVALVISQVVILYSATRRDIFQILRMGQRE
ncbi:MAG: FtsX-like permease family protein [Chloroflexi bacterium]|nr:FtsX-like permease family protein [Chloroflexota bacterium]